MTKALQCATAGMMLGLALCPHLGSGAVVTNPPLTTGAPTASVIDPAGNQEVDVEASGATSQATLEALPGFTSVQNISGFAEKVTNIISFSDPTLPDFQWAIINKLATDSGKSTTDSRWNTSGGNAARLRMNLGASGDAQWFDVAIGEWDGASFGSTTRLPIAVGFTIASLNADESAEVTFRRAGGAADVVQTVTGAAEDTDGIDAYFGLLTDAAHPITSLKIKFRSTTGGIHEAGVDDFGFLVPPLPPKGTFITIR